MNYNYLLGDLVSKLNMGQRHRVRTMMVPKSRIGMDLLFLLLELGLIRGIKLEENSKVRVSFRYQGGSHFFYKLSLVSKPSKRVY